MNKWSSNSDLDECNCSCHNSSNCAEIIHCVACCRECPYCYKNIIISAYDRHKEQCELEDRERYPEQRR